MLVDACVIDIIGEGSVNFDDRGDVEDALRILSGLIIVIPAADRNPDVDDQIHLMDTDNYDVTGADIAPADVVLDSSRLHVDNDSLLRVSEHNMVRLAHFSVKEYLESSRILAGTAHYVHLQPGREHYFLATSCLTYLMHYSSSDKKVSNDHDLSAFKLLLYAAQSWFYHSALKESNDVGHEVALLQSETAKQDWLKVYHSHSGGYQIFEDRERTGSALYYASYLGLEAVARRLLASPTTDVNAVGGTWGTALMTASEQGYESVVRLLLECGAEFNNAVECFFSNPMTPLMMASLNGHESVVRLLLKWGAEVNTVVEDNDYSTALQAAAAGGYKAIVRLLLEWGAKVNTVVEKGHVGTAIQSAVTSGNEAIAQLLLEWGAEVNTVGKKSEYGTALQTAATLGNEAIARLLLKWGAEVDAVAEDSNYGTALIAASCEGHKAVVVLLLEHGADVNLYTNTRHGNGTALQLASNSILISDGILQLLRAAMATHVQS
jgi:ankyrin repeat protein